LKIEEADTNGKKFWKKKIKIAKNLLRVEEGKKYISSCRGLKITRSKKDRKLDGVEK
jgi:hypothetical protein